MSDLAMHFPTGCWQQPDSSYAGQCTCGHTFHAATYASAKNAWAKHAAPDAAAIRPDSWTATAEDVREQVLLLAEVELHLQSCRVFLKTREKMHSCGVDLHDELLAKVTAAIEMIGREKVNG